MSGTDVFSRAATEYEQRIAEASARAAAEHERAVSRAEAHRRAIEAEQLTEAQNRIEVTWRYLRESLERRAELFRRALDGVWSDAELAQHLGIPQERITHVAGRRGGERQ